MKQSSAMFRRLLNSAVVWSWAFNALRLGSGLILLPLLIRVLPEEELGMYYVFLRLTALVSIIDFGFSVTVGRQVSYAMGGAPDLKAQGLVPTGQPKPANFALLWRLVFAYRHLYRYLTIAALVVLGIGGTWNVSANVSNTLSPTLTWAAWGITLLAAVWEVYFGWWNVFLGSMDRVLLSTRFAVLGYSIQICLAATLLLLGCGLLSVPIGSFCGSLVQRSLSRKRCLDILGAPSIPDSRVDRRKLLHILWPNTWRVGLQFLSVYIGMHVPALTFAAIYGSDAFAPYALSFHLFAICSGMSVVWTHVKWPAVGQCRARQDYAALRRLVRPRLLLQIVTFFVLATAAIAIGPRAINWINPDKFVLDTPWLVLMAVAAFLETQFSFWTTLLSLENRIPSLWPTVATNIVSVLLAFALLRNTTLTYQALVLAPLISGMLFNFWYWQFSGARNIGTTWLRFMFHPRGR